MTEKKQSVYETLPNIRSVFPKLTDQFRDLDKAIDEFIIDTRVAPFFSKSSRFFTQGSCFAEHLHNGLSERGYTSHWAKWIEDLNSPLALALHFHDNLNPGSPLRQQVDDADVAVITVGVAACWFRNSDNAFVLANDLNLREIAGYTQRTLSVTESRDCLLAVIRKLKRAKPQIKIVLTLSPVPLARTFEFHSAIVADAVSKSVLRAAIHETVSQVPNDVFYFPSFEIVTWLGRYHGDAFGADDKSSRHVSNLFLDAVLRSFIRHYQIPDGN